MPRISVVVPAYNYGKYLREAIASIQAQEGEHDLEIIVVNNASTDDTEAVLASIHEPRMRVVRLPMNQGVSGAYNAGIDEARGEYVTFLDADDRWRPGKLRHQVAVLEAEPDLGAIFSDFVRFNDGESSWLPGTQFDYFPGLEAMPAMPTRVGGARRFVDPFCSLIELSDVPAWMQSFVFRRSAIGDIRMVPGMRLCQDTHFVLRVFHRTGVAFSRELVVEVRRHGRNTTDAGQQMTHAKVDAFRMLLDEPLTSTQRRALRRRIGRALVDSGGMSLKQGQPLPAARSFLGALRYPGFRAHALARLAMVPAALISSEAAAV